MVDPTGEDNDPTDPPDPTPGTGAPVPPPGFAGAPITPPPGFAAVPPAAPPPAMAVPPAPAARPPAPRRGSRWPVVLLILLIVGAVAGFLIVSGGDDDDAPPATTTVATTAPTTSTTRVEDITDRASTVACQAELRTVETAVSSYTAVHGEPPPDLAALVGEFLDAPPTLVTYTPEGGVVPAPDCS